VPEFQLIGYLALFAEHGVEYLLVGGVGARIQGTATTTQDLDIVPEPSLANLTRLAVALSDPTTERMAGGDRAYLPHPRVEPSEFATATIASYRTRFGAIDVLMELPGVGGYDVLVRRARRYEWNDIVLSVASLDDIIESKESSDRAKDLRALDALYAARESLRRQPDDFAVRADALDPGSPPSGAADGD